MKITGPFFDRSKRDQPKPWYLRYSVAVKNSDGSVVLNDEGRIVLKRCRPYYKTKVKAEEDKPAILAQYAAAGTSAAGGVITRDQAIDVEQARTIVPEASFVDLAQFWRLHHPLRKVERLQEYLARFLADVTARLGATHQARDLKYRVGALCRVFGDRIPATITRTEAFAYLKGMTTKGRTVRNHKTAACTFFNYLRDLDDAPIKVNPFAGIKKRQLPREEKKEIGFLSLEFATRYLRAAERYDPELVAHEVIQLLAGVRADDEMANFDGRWVIAATREVVIPAAIAKMDRRQVINTLEENFWAWWQVYGREGILRPTSYLKRWRRLRILASLPAEKADELARLPLQTITKQPEAAAALAAWPWNARRRTFCTYHVAKYQSADRTALILRQIGGTETLHNSYRGLGVTHPQGKAYFALLPHKVRRPILADRSRARKVIHLPCLATPKENAPGASA